MIWRGVEDLLAIISEGELGIPRLEGLRAGVGENK